MNTWNRLPLLRILIPFILGISLSLTFNNIFNIDESIIVGFSLILIFFIFNYKKFIRNYKHRWIFGLCIHLFFIIFGYLITSNYKEVNCKTDFSHVRSKQDTVIATILDPIQERSNSYKVLLGIQSIKKNNQWLPVTGKAMTYFTKDSAAAELKYGDCIVLFADFSEVKAPQNPEEFNYKKYLSMQSVFSQGFVKSERWHKLATGKGNWVKQQALNIRNIFLHIFKENNLSGEEYAVSAALILGYTDKIDSDLISVYQGTGALHILSVSGMHVGVIFIVLNFLLIGLEKTKSGKIIKPIILVLMIWFYAAITGFSPAVNRAATMITFVIIGQSFNRYTNIYNTIAASAIFLLLLNPLLLANIGFQLSYVAVIGIVILQKRIYNWWIPKSWLLNQLWLIVSVSLAAQIATAPLSLYYFHQFPNYFLLTNIIIVPPSNFIIYSGIALLLFSPITFISSFFGSVLVYLVYGLNQSIRYIESLPMSVTHQVNVSLVETIFAYLAIIIIAYYFYSKRKILIFCALTILILLFSSISIRQIQLEKQKKIIVYHINKSTAIDFISGKNHMLLCDSSLIKNEKAMNMHIKNNWDKNQLNSPQTFYMHDLLNSKEKQTANFILIKRNIIQFYKKRIAWVIKDEKYLTSKTPINVDYLVISGNINTKIADVLNLYKPKMIVLDLSNAWWKLEKWEKECNEFNIPCYSIAKSGAFVSEL